MKNKRIDWIDVARGIAMICVILVHAEEHFLKPKVLAVTKIPIYTFHMPIFFFISGYLFSMKDSFKEFFKNKCRRILIPYVCLGVVMCLFNAWWEGESLLDNLWGILVQNRKWTLWFLACLFCLNLLFYVLVKFIKNERMRAITVVLVATAGIIYYKLGGASLYWNIDACMTALPFFYVGFLCKKTDFVNQKVLASRFKWGIFAGLAAVDFISTKINYMVTEEYLEFFDRLYGIAPLTYIGSFAGVFALIIFADGCRRIRTFRYIGENSMLFFAWHQTILLPLIEFAFRKLKLFRHIFLVRNGEYYARMIVCTIVACIASALINEIIHRCKLRFMVGK